MRLEDKVAIIVGAGQTPGETLGNGRATSLLFAREGAKLLLVDKDKTSAEETASLVQSEGGTAEAVQADVQSMDDCERFAARCKERFGRIDILHNNVGIGAGDAPVHKVNEETWLRILDVNLTGAYRSCHADLPIMREQGYGCITNISSVAAICATRTAAYRASKAGMNAMSQDIAMSNAKYGIRVNVIMPGLMDTPMAIEGYAKARGVSREEVREGRNKLVPLQKQMGTAWDVAYAALYLSSDEAKFVTGALLPVDGGQSAKVG